MEKVSKTKRRKRLKRALIVILVIVVALVIACGVYLSKYYHADVNLEDYKTAVTQTKDGILIEGDDEGYEDLIIFYPGAKVEHTAYLPLCYELAENGVDCYIAKMPGNLAFFDINKAEKIVEKYDYDNYYMAGHSLGGAMGALYVAKHLDEFEGLILLAAYPTKSLAAEGLRVLSVYGSEDQVIHMEKIVEGRQFMPADYTEICIQGGNHAQFGNYGVQEGDGAPSITTEEQQKQTVEAILEMVK